MRCSFVLKLDLNISNSNGIVYSYENIIKGVILTYFMLRVILNSFSFILFECFCNSEAFIIDFGSHFASRMTHGLKRCGTRGQQ